MAEERTPVSDEVDVLMNVDNEEAEITINGSFCISADSRNEFCKRLDALIAEYRI